MRESRAGRLRSAVPALITGGAGDDPAGIVTYTIVGAGTGFSQLWLLVISTPMLVAATGMAARIALATRAGLGTVLRRRYGRPVSAAIVLVLAAANVATIAADTAGVAAALSMATGWRWELFVPIVLALLAVVVLADYRRTKQIFTMLALVLLSYAVAAVLAQPDWAHVARASVLPEIRFEQAWMVSALGLLGTTISPYMLFWQADEEAEELRHGTTIRAAEESMNIWLGMAFGNLVSFFIIVAAATRIEHGASITDVADAARALEPLGVLGQRVFIVGIIAAGLLALPVLAGATAYAVAEVFGWHEGLSRRAAQARGFYLVLGAALAGGAVISLLPDFHPVQALFYSQVLDGVLLPVMIVILMVLSNDRAVVGHEPNPAWVNVAGVVTVVATVAANVAALVG